MGGPIGEVPGPGEVPGEVPGREPRISENLVKVSTDTKSYIKEKIQKEGEFDPSKVSLSLIPAVPGAPKGQYETDMMKTRDKGSKVTDPYFGG